MSGVTFEITDRAGNDLLGCEQPDPETARLAARTLVRDGHDRVDIYRLVDGERSEFPVGYATVCARSGGVNIQSTTVGGI